MILKNLHHLPANQRGLMLAELLAVMVIVMIIVSFTILTIGKVINNSKKDAHIANALRVIDATRIGEESGEVNFINAPNSTVEVFESDGNEKIVKKIIHLGNVQDPWKRQMYLSVKVQKDLNKETYRVWLDVNNTSISNICPIQGKSIDDLVRGREVACK